MKYTVTVTESPVCIAHQLHLPYESKCNDLHGHNYTVEVVLTTNFLNSNGMVCDFTHVKAVIKKYDHSFLGAHGPAGTKCFDVEPSTAENFARVLFEELGEVVPSFNPHAHVLSVSVWETPSSKVVISE